MVRKSILAAVLVALAACTSTSDYIPAEAAKATLGGRTAAQYSVPSSDDPKADLRLASFGFTKLKKASSGEEVRAVHVRASLVNNSDEPVTFDVREQRLQFSDGQKVPPASAKASAAGVPIVDVTPRSTRTVDLFFPVPPALAKASHVPSFDVAWTVHVGSQAYARVTPFERVAVDPAVAAQQAATFGPWGWYDPLWGPGEPGWPSWGW